MTRAEYVTSRYHYQSEHARALMLHVGLVRAGFVKRTRAL